MRKKAEPEFTPAMKKALDKGGMVVPKKTFDDLVEEAHIPVVDVTDKTSPEPAGPQKYPKIPAYMWKKESQPPPSTQKFEVVANYDFAGMQQVMHAIETFKSLVYISVMGFCALLLANLTGVVASLALYKGQVAPLAFGCGALFALVCFFASYWTQSVLYAEDMKRAAPNSHLLWVKSGFIAALASLVFFIGGIIAVVQ
jgi:hypothetical protein